MPDAKRPALSRGAVVTAALHLVETEGLGALTMRHLADLLAVKAASLYWHVRDRDEVVQLLANSLLSETRVRTTHDGWRSQSLAVCAALERTVSGHRDAARLLLEVPETVERSDVHRLLQRALESGGLTAGPARDAATMMLLHVLVRGLLAPASDRVAAAREGVASLAIDSGSRGVSIRAGAASMRGLVQTADDPNAPAAATIRGDAVTVRRLRGGRQGAIELNPSRPWTFKVQAPTWNTVLDLAGIEVRGIHIDSPATRVECVLPPPAGVVPIHVSSGAVGVRIRRPSGIPVVAELSAGVVKVKLDDYSIGATTGDLVWQSSPAAGEVSHYLLRVSSGAVRVSLEQDSSLPTDPSNGYPTAPPDAQAVDALSLILDGIVARSASMG